MYKLLHFDHIISNKQAVYMYKYTNRLHVLKNNKLKKNLLNSTNTPYLKNVAK